MKSRKVKIGNKEYTITKNINYGEIVADLMINQPNLSITIDEFFDKMGIPKNARSDFMVAALYKNAYEIVEKRTGKRPSNKDVENIIDEGKDSMKQLDNAIDSIGSKTGKTPKDREKAHRKGVDKMMKNIKKVNDEEEQRLFAEAKKARNKPIEIKRKVPFWIRMAGRLAGIRFGDVTFVRK